LEIQQSPLFEAGLLGSTDTGLKKQKVAGTKPRQKPVHAVWSLALQSRGGPASRQNFKFSFHENLLLKKRFNRISYL
jgi:hypothetical protein